MFSLEGLESLYARVPAIESAGFFSGSDWDYPQTLVPSLAARTVRHGDVAAALVESLSQIRLLAVVKDDYSHASISAEHAHHFLAQVLAMNLDLVAGDLQESDRLGRKDSATPFRTWITICWSIWAMKTCWNTW